MRPALGTAGKVCMFKDLIASKSNVQASFQVDSVILDFSVSTQHTWFCESHHPSLCFICLWLLCFAPAPAMSQHHYHRPGKQGWQAEVVNTEWAGWGGTAQNDPQLGTGEDDRLPSGCLLLGGAGAWSCVRRTGGCGEGSAQLTQAPGVCS